jgi:quinol monooxygenase YgiN
MLIVAGWLRVHADQREEYLLAANEASRLARAATGCLEFVQAADPLVPGRIIILERWESEADLASFRNSGPDDETRLCCLTCSTAT